MDWTRDIDATCSREADVVWLFKQDQCAKYDIGSDVIEKQGLISDLWPGLKDTIFASGLNAAFHRDGTTIWFFKGDQCAKYLVGSDRIETSGDIKKLWPGLD